MTDRKGLMQFFVPEIRDRLSLAPHVIIAPRLV